MRKFSVVVAAILAVSLGLKLASNRGDLLVDQKGVAVALAAELQHHGFAARTQQRGTETVVIAGQGDCRILARDYTPYGTMREVWEEKAKSYGPLRYLWHGKFYNQAPKLQPLLALYIQRELFRIGVETNRAPIIALAASPTCVLPTPLFEDGVIGFNRS